RRPHLRAQPAGPVEGEPRRAPAQRRVLLLLGDLETGQHLVAADVDGAEGARLAARRVEHVAIEPLLRLGAREGGGDHELKLGAEQADAGRPDRKSTRLNSSHVKISYADFCFK